MKKILLPALLCALLVSCIYSQNGQPSESQQLSQQIGTLYQQGKFDEAIPLAEKAVEIEKKISKNSEGYAVLTLNLAMLHKERMRRLNNQLPSLSKDDLQKAHKKINDDAKDAEELMRDSLKTYQQLNMGESPAAALLKYELAWLLSNYQTYVFMPVGIREKIDEAEKLYTEALASQEKTAGSDGDPAIRTVLALGDFYTRWINFEKALPYYERYIAATEKKAGANNKALIPALRGMMEISIITDRQNEAKELAERIGSISGKPEALPVPSPNLALRSKKIEKVSNAKFIPPERSNDLGFIFSQAAGAGAYSPMGSFRTKSVLVNIVVDEKGDVVEAQVAQDIKNKEEIERAAMQSKFRPFSYKGESHKMRGTILYAYLD